MNPSGTTKKRLTLIELDQRVAATGARRPRPRARASAAALGADVLEQIDLMRGRGTHSRKRGLAALVDSPRSKPARVSATVRAYDFGAPVRPAPTSSVFSLPFAADAGTWRAFTYRDGDDAITTGFAVEVFEEDPARQPQDVPPAQVAPPDASSVAVQPVGLPPVPVQPGVPAEVPVATALSGGQREDGFLGLDLSSAAASDREDAEQFEREIQAILAGETTRPAAPPAAMTASSVRPDDSIAPPSRPHDIFEQMGQNMAYATAFNLPPMELGRRFDEMEREIALEEQAQARRPADRLSLELSDEEISANLWPRPAPTGAALPKDAAPAPPGVPTDPAPTVVAPIAPGGSGPPQVAATPPAPALPAITAPTTTPPPVVSPPAPATPTDAAPVAVENDAPVPTAVAAPAVTAPPPAPDGAPANNGRSKP